MLAQRKLSRHVAKCAPAAVPYLSRHYVAG